MMNTIRSLAVTGLTVLALMLAVALTPLRQPFAQSVNQIALAAGASPVLVTNTKAHPVPVVAQGTTQVSGVVTLDSNGNAVRIANLASDPVPVVDSNLSGQEPYQHEFTDTIDPGIQGILGDGFHIPAGKRLVIEYVSMHTSLPTGQVTLFGITTRVNGAVVEYYLPVTEQGSSQVFLANQAMHIYADSDPHQFWDVAFRVEVSPAGPASVSAQVSGYLVDAP